jgi:glutamate-1-semialdehyde aminotransferase
LEPTVFEAPKPGFLEGLRELCDRKGALLIFDEMWTGFRLALGGSQEKFGVRADLACFSKAVANGMPLSILTGRKDVMRLLDKDVFFFTTFGGEALSLAAAKATINELREKKVVSHLERQGKALKDGYNAIAKEAGLDCTACVGFDQRSLMTFTGESPLDMKSLVQQEMIARGVLWGGFHNVCFSHSDDDVARILAAYREVLPILAEALKDGSVKKRLRGSPVEPVFRKTSNFHIKPKPKG